MPCKRGGSHLISCAPHKWIGVQHIDRCTKTWLIVQESGFLLSFYLACASNLPHGTLLSCAILRKIVPKAASFSNSLQTALLALQNKVKHQTPHQESHQKSHQKCQVYNCSYDHVWQPKSNSGQSKRLSWWRLHGISPMTCFSNVTHIGFVPDPTKIWSKKGSTADRKIVPFCQFGLPKTETSGASNIPALLVGDHLRDNFSRLGLKRRSKQQQEH